MSIVIISHRLGGKLTNIIFSDSYLALDLQVRIYLDSEVELLDWSECSTNAFDTVHEELYYSENVSSDDDNSCC